MRGIDVSIHNYPVNWQTVKKACTGFAICCTGYGIIISSNAITVADYV